MIFWEMERGGTTTVLQPNVVGGSMCHQAVEHLTVNSNQGAFDAIHTLITDGLPTVEATCDGMRPFASVLSRPSVGG